MRLIDYRDVDPNVWDRFALEHGWFWHTSLWRDYCVAYEGEVESDGFALFDGPDLIALAPIASHGPIWAPAIRSDLGPRDRMRAWEMCLRQRCVQLSPLIPQFPERALEFLAATTRRGYADTSLTTSVIDLTQSEDEILRRMSKGHRHTIKHSDASVIGEDVTSFGTYYRLHRPNSPRPEATYAEMWRWVTLGHAVVVTAEADTGVEGACLILLHGESAAYSSSVGWGGQAMIWAAIRWLKQEGFKRFELGTQYRGILAHDRSTAKDQSISLFKRGFGGQEVPLLIREPPTTRSAHDAIRSDRQAYGHVPACSSDR